MGFTLRRSISAFPFWFTLFAWGLPSVFVCGLGIWGRRKFSNNGLIVFLTTLPCILWSLFSVNELLTVLSIYGLSELAFEEAMLILVMMCSASIPLALALVILLKKK